MMKRKRLDFVICGRQECQKIPPPKTPSTTICKVAENFVITPPLFFADVINEKHLTLKPIVNIILFNTTICKWVKTYLL